MTAQLMTAISNRDGDALARMAAGARSRRGFSISKLKGWLTLCSVS
jgi:hypothetical protein